MKWLRKGRKMKRLNKRFGFEPSDAFKDEEDINPMNYIGNMSDAMLVLAVGIMLALIMAWNVNIGESESIDQAEATEVEDVNALKSATEDSSTSLIDQSGLTEAGTLYKDAEGNYYVIDAN